MSKNNTKNWQDNKLHIAWKILIIISGIIAFASIIIILFNDIEQKPLGGKKAIEARSSEEMGGNFELIDHNGEKFSSTQLKGKYSLLYFGFTFCPDICPFELKRMGSLVKELEPLDINPVFITLDPKRDTIDIIKEYISYFHPKMIGLTGSKDQVKKAADLYKVYYAVAQKKKGTDADDYMLDHTAFIYFLDKNAKYVTFFNKNDTPKAMADTIKSYILNKK